MAKKKNTTENPVGELILIKITDITKESVIITTSADADQRKEYVHELNKMGPKVPKDHGFKIGDGIIFAPNFSFLGMKADVKDPKVSWGICHYGAIIATTEG
jgi:hypothetical protein